MSPQIVATETCVVIETDADIDSARQAGRSKALRIGFPSAQATLLATAISELARNILHYAGRGEIVLTTLTHSGPSGIRVTARDQGPGIGDLSRAMEDGYSTSGRLGLGLPGVKRLADRFEIVTSADKGTVVSMTMWAHEHLGLGAGERYLETGTWEWEG